VSEHGLATAAGAGALARLAWAGLRAAPPGGADLWARKNHRGEPLTLLEGPAYAAAAAASARRSASSSSSRCQWTAASVA
jgi:hypothetical protein